MRTSRTGTSANMVRRRPQGSFDKARESQCPLAHLGRNRRQESEGETFPHLPNEETTGRKVFGSVSCESTVAQRIHRTASSLAKCKTAHRRAEGRITGFISVRQAREEGRDTTEVSVPLYRNIQEWVPFRHHAQPPELSLPPRFPAAASARPPAPWTQSMSAPRQQQSVRVT